MPSPGRTAAECPARTPCGCARRWCSEVATDNRKSAPRRPRSLILKRKDLRALRASVVRLCFCFFLAACADGVPFEGLAPAQATGGPMVNFDLTHRPLPDIPFPNDLATRPDPASPTGLRANASLIV